MTKQTHAGRMPHIWRVLAPASVLAVAPMVTGLPGGVAVVGVTWPRNAVSAPGRFQIPSLTSMSPGSRRR